MVSRLSTGSVRIENAADDDETEGALPQTEVAVSSRRVTIQPKEAADGNKHPLAVEYEKNADISDYEM